MNLADLEWPDLIDLLHHDVRTRTAVRDREAGEMYERAWGEFRVRVSNLARVLRRSAPSTYDRESIDDAVQQLILRFQSEDVLRRLVEADSPRSYLAVIIRNALADAARADTRRQGAIRETLPFAVDIREPPLRNYEVRRLLSSLPPDDRQILYMRFWRGLTIAEVAAELGITYSAAAMRIVRLLGKLRQAL